MSGDQESTVRQGGLSGVQPKGEGRERADKPGSIYQLFLQQVSTFVWGGGQVECRGEL